MPHVLSSLTFRRASQGGGYARTMPSRRRAISPGSTAAAYPYDQAWLDHVKAWIKEQGRGSQAKLAEAAKIEPGTLSQMLSGPPGRSSVAVPAINRVVGLPPPRFASGSADERDLGAQIDATLAILDGEDAALFRDMIESAVKHARRMAERSRTKSKG